MGNPCVIGMRFNEMEKLSYSHNGGCLGEDSDFYDLALHVQKYSNEQLKTIWNIILPIDENLFFDNNQEQGKLKDILAIALPEGGLLNDEQKIALEVFSNAGITPQPLTSGQVLIGEHPRESSYNAYYLDLNKQLVQAVMGDSISFGIPFSTVRSVNEVELASICNTLKDAWSKISGRGATNDGVADVFTSGKITQSGQITIPAEIRKHLKIKEGDRLVFEQLYNEEVMINKYSTFLLKIIGLY